MTAKGRTGRAGEGTRLQKVLSRAGIASRRKAETLISEGHVSVNGKIVRELGVRVSAKDLIRVDGQSIDRRHRNRYVLVNKPAGVLCSASDPQGRKLVTDLLPPRMGRLFPVGRLDYNSEGAIILTNDGNVANRLAHPRFEVEKVYAVKVRGLIEKSDPRLSSAMSGLTLDDGAVATVKRIKVFRTTGKNTWLEWVLSEGKNREIRKICASLDFDVVRLLRRAIGPIELGNLRSGEFRELNKAEVQALREMVKS